MLSRRIGVAVAGLMLALAACATAQSPSGNGSTTPATPAKSGRAGGDVPIVEKLLSIRKDYQTTLESLRIQYINNGDIERARWAEEELLQFHRITKHPYRLELEVPPPSLPANVNVPEANELYRRAMTFKGKGWGTDFVDNQRRAELLLQQLLTLYPQSDKIGDAAYQLGDIYESRAYRHYGRAAQYFERCFQWNPKTQSDARLRAARLYERTSERGRAIEIYRDITTHETDSKRIEEAQKRINDLSNRR
jgi:TolA-binding protein